MHRPPALSLASMPLALTLALVACNGDAPSGADSAGVPPPVPDAPAVEVPAAPATGAAGEAAPAPPETDSPRETREVLTKPPQLDPETAKKNAAAFKAALAEGRKATRARAFDEALSAFDIALTLDPNHPGALGERGWAAFQKGDLKLARVSTDAALLHTRTDRRRAALLYNLGRIEEAEGRLEIARELYRRSLDFRVDKTVALHFDRLSALTGSEHPSTSTPRIDTPEALCTQLLSEQFYCDEPDTECSCKVGPRAQSEPLPDATPLEIGAIAVLEASSFTGGMGETAGAYLAAQTRSGGWQVVAQIGDASIPGVSYISNDYKIRSLAVRPGRSNHPLFIVETSQQENDGDYGSNVMEFVDTEHLWVCGKTDKGPRCAGLETKRTVGLDKMLDDGDAPDPAEWGPLGEHTWSLAAKVDGHEVRFEPSGEFPEGREPSPEITGTLPLDRLLDAAWTDHHNLR